MDSILHQNHKLLPEKINSLGSIQLFPLNGIIGRTGLHFNQNSRVPPHPLCNTDHFYRKKVHSAGELP
jgi:hypothetical protein